MKVYCEEPSGLQLLENIIKMQAQYRWDHLKKPNRIEMTQTEYDVLEDFLSSFAGFHREYSHEMLNKKRIMGMEINII